MMTRRGALVKSLKFAGLFAGAALVAGCDQGNSGGPASNKNSAEQQDYIDKSNAASAAHAAEEAKKKR
jgi:hypothetical protein